jgi:hypothetical protein
VIKGIGEDLALDPELGPLIREPLKGKLYRVDPGVKIFRCKFMTTPGCQFDVRTAALKRMKLLSWRQGSLLPVRGRRLSWCEEPPIRDAACIGCRA